MLSKVISCSFVGVSGFLVDVEVDISNGMPMFNIVGLGDTAVLESRDRVRSAMKNMNFDIMPKRITVNLSPADIRKEGASFDLPIAIGILSSFGYIKDNKLGDYMILGELSLSGEIKKVKGIINSIITTKEKNLKGIILPYDNAPEASLISGVEIIPVKTLKEVAEFLNGMPIENYKFERPAPQPPRYDVDFKDIKGQSKAKRAMEIAAAGGHNVFMVGSPGSGKSMIAKRFPTILPSMSEEEIVETTKIYSIAGLLTKDLPLVNTRPFRSPHHTSSDVSLIGGGAIPKPGEISLSHNGVLFLDEVSEFPRQVLEVLRQPLEDRIVTVARANSTIEFPASFMMLAASNPCHCGYLYETSSDSPKKCSCTNAQINNYQKKISGPIIDRMDIYLEIKRLSDTELMRYEDGESSADIKIRVDSARTIQRKRYNSHRTNSQMSAAEVKKHCRLDSPSELIMKSAIQNLGLSGRGFDKILRVARTIADLNDSPNIQKEHLVEAIGYRKM